MAQDNRPLRAFFAPVRALFVSDASAGVLLIVVAVLAMVVANSAYADLYHHVLHDRWGPTLTPKLGQMSLHLWINDGLMAVFFFVVGLEVKREWIEGQLSSAEQRRLPILAAVAGMAVPAMVYLFFVQGGEARLVQGWAIPAATDIAFAMGVLGLLGSRVPASLRLFLLTVAIVDDIGAVLVIALFYTAGIKLLWLTAAVVVVGIMFGLNRMRVSSMVPFILLALVLWYFVLNSGIHATIAGVVAALTIPMVGKNDDTMLERLEHGLAPWSAYLVVPVFGFANAGVNLSGLGIEGVLAPLPIAIAAGLFLGKQIGIFSAIWVADRIGFAKRPFGARWPEIWGVTVLCGIGFTMSLFIGELAFPGYRELIDEAKIGILGGSLLSAVVGYVILRLATDPARQPDPQEPRPA
ncbi:MAG: Na+/H+ antiporter NhaA [Sphingomonadaceae bacterium]